MNEVDSSAIIRDLEMLLDQLYFWAKRAQESRSTSDDGRMLGVATANLEAFVTTLLDCFRPLELVRIRVPTSTLVSAIGMRARGELGAASVTVSGEANEIVSSDADSFRFLSEVEVQVDGRRHFHKSWNVTVPRKLN